MIHLSTGKRVGLLCRASIAVAVSIPLLGLRAVGGIVSCLLALETGDVTQILLSRSRTVLVAIASIARLEVVVVVAIVPIPSMVMSSMIMSSMGVMGVSSRVWGIAGLLLSSGVVLPLIILPLAAINLLLLSFKDDGLVY